MDNKDIALQKQKTYTSVSELVNRPNERKICALHNLQTGSFLGTHFILRFFCSISE